MYYPCSQAGHCKYFLNRLQLLTFNLSHSKLELIFNLFSGISWIYIYCDFKNLVINVNVFVKSVCLAQPKSCYTDVPLKLNSGNYVCVLTLAQLGAMIHISYLSLSGKLFLVLLQ